MLVFHPGRDNSGWAFTVEMTTTEDTYVSLLPFMHLWLGNNAKTDHYRNRKETKITPYLSESS